MKKTICILSVLLLFLVPAFAQTQPNTVKSVTFTIASSGSLSAAVDMSACTPIRIVTPTTWTAANMTFQSSYDGVAYGNLYDEFGAEVTVVMPTEAASASVTIRLVPSDWWSMRFMKIRSGPSTAPAAQAGARTIKVICR